MKRVAFGSVLALLVVAAGSVAHAADQTVLGSSLQLKNPGTPDKAKLTGKAKEKASGNTIVGDPTVSGATLTVRANGTTPTSQTFNLPQGTSPSTGKLYWTGTTAKGFAYKDPKLENGPIKGASIKKSGGGVFQIKVSGSGKVAPLTVLPPNTGTDGCILLQIGGGDSYSVRFAPLDGIITNKGPLQYSHKKPSGEATCVTTTTTTTTTSSTTTTTIPVCSPNCGIGTPCTGSGQCASGLCSGGFCRCPNQAFTFSVSSNSGGPFDSAEWPGGTATQNGASGCSVTINRPNNNIDLVCTLAGAFSINSFGGYSNCFGTGGEDGDGCQVTGCPFAGIGSCCNARPSCSVALNGSGSAQYHVQCLQ